MSDIYCHPCRLSDNPVFFRGQEPYCRIGAWVWLFDHAQVRDQPVRLDGKMVLLRRGQLAETTRDMARAWGWPETGVRRFLQQCVSGGEIKYEHGAKTNVITICNYEDYPFYNEHPGAKSAQSNDDFESSDAVGAPFNGAVVVQRNGNPQGGAKPAQSWRKVGAATNVSPLGESADNSFRDGETDAKLAQSWRDVGAATDSYVSSEVGFASSSGDFGNHKNENPQGGAMLAQSWRKVGATTNCSRLGEYADNSFQNGETGAKLAQSWRDVGAATKKDANDAPFPTFEDIGEYDDDTAPNRGEPQKCCAYSFQNGEIETASRVQGTYQGTVRTKEVSKEESKEGKKEKTIVKKKESQPENHEPSSKHGEARQEARPVAALTQPAAAGLKNEIEGRQARKLHPVTATAQPELFASETVSSVPPIDVVKLVKPKPLTAETDPQFQEFWTAYPKKIDRALAYAAYKTALRDGATHAALMSGVASYLFPDFQYCTRAHIWLANKQWLPKHQQRSPPAPREPRGPMSMREAGIRFYGGSL